ncbi:hypothetical protein [uncultured Paludibaculum sp.]|uniref:hypothetical protein n=1 Tax=uncultured Paludibaculum sp. TaxID=1765020 RepID=UPI002AAABE2C|nr:hypothetical protein [uncultured Paludibaculum sp.]
MTDIVDAKVLKDDEESLKERGYALLARKKKEPRPVPDDRSARCEELTHLFVGDKNACQMVAQAIAKSSNGEFFGPQCGRSGRDVKVITCKDGADDALVETYGAIACHCTSERLNQRLQVKKVLLTNKVYPHWDTEFTCSYLANANGIDPEGGLPGVPQTPQAGCECCGTKASQAKTECPEDAGGTS